MIACCPRGGRWRALVGVDERRIGTRGARSRWRKPMAKGSSSEGPQVELTIIKTSGDRFVDASHPGHWRQRCFHQRDRRCVAQRRNRSRRAFDEGPADGSGAGPGHRRRAGAGRPARRVGQRDGRTFRELPARRADRRRELEAQIPAFTLSRRSIRWRRSAATSIPVCRKLDDGEADALVMAAAGLKRIGREDRITRISSLDDICVSAAAQGALASRRATMMPCAKNMEFLDDMPTHSRGEGGASLLESLGGGCHVPVAARAQVDGEIDRSSSALSPTLDGQ